MRQRPPSSGPDRARLIALAAAAVTALNFPLLLVWDRPVAVLGLPLLGVAIFAIWVALIGALIWVTECAPRPPADPGHPADPPLQDRG